jgi:hypothetical protein
MGAWVGTMHTPSFGYPFKFYMNFHHLSIFLRDFGFFFLNFFVHQAQVELFVLTIGIFIV